MNHRRNYGRCPHCGRTVWPEPLRPRPRSVNGLAVHRRCHRLITAPPTMTSPAVGIPAAALITHPA